MNKCAEKDNLLLYIAGELSASDSAKMKAHIASCSECRAELDAVRADEAALKASVDNLFEAHRSKDIIMKKLSTIPAPVLPTAGRKSFFSMWHRLAGAFLLTLAVALAVFFSMPDKHHEGFAGMVTMQASDNDCSVNGAFIGAGMSLPLMAGQPMQLRGSFDISYNNCGVVSVIRFEGNASASLIDGKLAFENSSAAFELVSGDNVDILVNGSSLELAVKSSKEAAAPVCASEPVKISVSVPDKKTSSENKQIAAENAILENENSTESAAKTSDAVVSVELSAGAADASGSEMIDEADTTSQILDDERMAPSSNPFAGEALGLTD